MPTHFTIHPLRAEQSAFVPGLLAIFGAAFEGSETYSIKRPDANYLRKLLAKDKVIALAAVQAERVVGGLVASKLQKNSAAAQRNLHLRFGR